MDKEQREALELSKDDLLAKKKAGRSADVARSAPARIRKPKKDLNQLAAAIVAQATDEPEAVSGLVVAWSETIKIVDPHFREERPIKVSPRSALTLT